MKNYKLEIYRTLLRQWRWRLKSNNGKIIGASSESFKNKKDCKHNAILVFEGIQFNIDELI